ncbi:unnamed protein product [Coffea canephora]|uniref:Uncharacterized protein n=1 Tax=Coffea canephora TaxID=49390 RepID=A0A068U5I4_COFCA|nr:unnamed protein product [Coffea canephora]
MSTSLDTANLALSSTVDEFAIEDTRIWDNRDRDTSLTIATIAYLALSKFSWMEAVFSFWCLCSMVLSRAIFHRDWRSNSW